MLCGTLAVVTVFSLDRLFIGPQGVSRREKWFFEAVPGQWMIVGDDGRSTEYLSVW